MSADEIYRFGDGYGNSGGFCCTYPFDLSFLVYIVGLMDGLGDWGRQSLEKRSCSSMYIVCRVFLVNSGFRIVL